MMSQKSFSDEQIECACLGTSKLGRIHKNQSHGMELVVEKSESLLVRFVMNPCQIHSSFSTYLYTIIFGSENTYSQPF